MIRSNGVRLLSSHLIRDACKFIYEGVFHRTLDSGLWTLSRVIGGGVGHGVNLNYPNTSIRGSASLSIDNNYAGFEDWCKHNGAIFSSEEDKHLMFRWFLNTYIYGRNFSFGCLPSVPHKDLIDCFRKFGRHGDSKKMYEFLYEKPRQAPAFPSYEEVNCTNDLSIMDELEDATKCFCPDCCISDELGLPDIEPSTMLLSNNGNSIITKI